MPSIFSLDLLVPIVFLGLAGLVAVSFIQSSSEKENREELLQRTFSSITESADTTAADEDYIKEVTSFIDSKIIDRFPWIGEKMVHAGWKMPGGLFLLIAFAIGGVLALIGFLMTITKLNILLVIFICASIFGVSVLFSFLFLEWRIGERTKTFDEQFGVGLDVMAAAMRSGSTFMNGLKFVAGSMDPPIGTEFGVLASELGLGVDIPTALDRFRTRVSSKNLFLFCVAVKVANSTGAALAPTFSTLSRVITERFKLQGMINIAIAENLGAMVFLAACPWGIIPILASSWPEAFGSFVALPLGQVIIAGLFLYYGFGIYLMYKTVRSIDT